MTFHARGGDSRGGATPMQAKWIKLDLADLYHKCLTACIESCRMGDICSSIVVICDLLRGFPMHTITILWQYFTSNMGILQYCIIWECFILYQQRGNCDCDWNCILQKGSHIIIITLASHHDMQTDWLWAGLGGSPVGCKIGILRHCYGSRCHWCNQKVWQWIVQS